jgi:hypothetical protein
MHLSLRAAFVSIAALSLPLSGCKVEGRVETLVRYEGQDRNESAAYTAGQSLLIRSRMGNVDVIAGSGDSLEVTFQPFTMDTDDNEQIATDQIRNLLKTEVITEGDLLTVQVWREDGASGNLGADIILTLPAGFDGDFQLDEEQGFVEIDLAGRARSTKVTHTGPGDVTVTGASGPLEIDTSVGDAEIDVASWGAGHVTTGNGDINIWVPAGANGSIQASANSVEPVVVGPDPLPADWTVAENSESSKSFTFGEGGDNVVLTTEDLGDIFIVAK